MGKVKKAPDEGVPMWLFMVIVSSLTIACIWLAFIAGKISTL